ncbi:MAG TPA: hypothetical protein VE956_01340 [Nodularia sp. (in: cyanobacteria)]|nr:hypothetical protein [Nodularia sp. (in: cyanobacteria)]
MDKNFPIAFVALSILAIAGCTIGETPEAVAPTPTATPTATESFSNPVVPSKEPQTNASATPNLIQLTNATEREQIVSKGRNDPFAQLFEPPVRRLPTATSTTTVPAIPPLPTAPSRVPLRGSLGAAPSTVPLRRLPTTVAGQPTLRSAPGTATSTNVAASQGTKGPKPNTGAASVLPKVMPGLVPNPTLGSVLPPPPPKPELAEGVMVSGVVLIGKEPQAIIKVPNEATSRYVQAGQRLSSGLLIKRIEMNEGSNPIVILEQYGIEVARMVGEAPVNAASSATKVEAS